MRPRVHAACVPTSPSSPRLLAPRLGHGHDLQKVAIGILEVETAPTPPNVDPAVAVAVWLTAVWNALGLHPAKDRVELSLVYVKSIVMASAGFGVETRPTPLLCLVGKIEGQAIVDLHLSE